MARDRELSKVLDWIDAEVGRETQCGTGMGLASAQGTPAAAELMTTASSPKEDPPGCAPTKGEGLQVWTGGPVDGVEGCNPPALGMGAKDEREC